MTDVMQSGGIEETNHQDVASQFPDALLAVGKKALANPDFVQRFRDCRKTEDLDFAMLQPKATIANELAWRRQNPA